MDGYLMMPKMHLPYSLGNPRNSERIFFSFYDDLINSDPTFQHLFSRFQSALSIERIFYRVSVEVNLDLIITGSKLIT
jgi:hypothetical protein